MDDNVEEAARRYERLMQQRRYQLAVSALGLDAASRARPADDEPDAPRVPRQMRRTDRSADEDAAD